LIKPDTSIVATTAAFGALTVAPAPGIAVVIQSRYAGEVLVAKLRIVARIVIGAALAAVDAALDFGVDGAVKRGIALSSIEPSVRRF
jgi:hypothetical protein